MSKPRHVVRPIDPPRRELFEDWSWPIHIALVTFGAYVIGIISAVLRFDENSIFYSAMTWTIVTIVCVGLLMFVAQWVNKHWLRRGLMLSLVLSLMLNLSVLVVLSWLHLFAPQMSTEDVVAESIEPEEPEKRPEFFALAVDGDDRPALDIEKPVTTGQPELEQNDIVQKTTINQDTERPQVDVASTNVSNIPQPIERAEIVYSAPRQSDQSSTLSRQRQLAEPRLAQPMVDNLPTPEAIQSQQLTAAPSEIQRQTTQTPALQLDLSDAATSDEAVRATRLSRRSNSDAEPDIAEATRPTTRSRERSDARPSRAAIVAGSRPTVSRQTDPNVPMPANVASRRQQTTTPERNPEIDQLVPDGVLRRSEVDARREQPLVDAEQLAEAPLSEPDRRQPVTVAPTSVDSLASQVAESEETVPTDTTAQPVDSSVARQTPRMPQPVINNGPVVDSVASSSQATARVPDRATASESPISTSDSTTESNLPRRALTPAIVAASPRANPADGTLASRQPTREPAASPARTAITNASQGTIGEGQAPNMDRGEAAPQSPVTVASASARRDNPTQQNRSGPSIAPMAGAKVPRSLAGAQVPTTNVRAQTTAAADNFDAATLAATQASAAAARLPRQAKAPVAQETAPVGQSDLDVGTVRVASNIGQRQPSGGGQPEIAQGELEAQQNLPRVGGTPNPSLPEPQTAKIVVSPPQKAQQSGERAIAAASPNVRQSTGVAASAGPESSPAEEANLAADTVRPAPAAGRTRSQVAEVNIAEVAAPGGGTGERLRTPLAKPLPVGTQAESVRLASQDQSSGVPKAVPLQSQGERSRRSTGGVYGPVVDEPIGAESDQIAQDGVPGAMTPAAIQRQNNASSDVPGPMLTDVAQVGADAPSARSTRQPKGLKADTRVDVPLAGANTVSDEVSPQLDTALASQAGEIDRSRSGGLVVPSETFDAIGGLSSEISSNVGVPSRKAQPDSQLVADSRARFIRRNVGGPLSIDTRVALPTDAFQNRINRRGEEPVGGNGRPSQRTEEAIELGLVYLAGQQLRDGSWSLNQADVGAAQPETSIIQSDTAATGLALLAFLGAGYHHHSDEYGNVVRPGLNYLIERQKPDGDLYLPQDEISNRSAWLYSHGIAAIALCEAYGMTQDPALREPAQKAIDFIVAAQHPQRGGWRYAPGVGSDTSVSGWMVMAMRSGELANLEVPSSAWNLVDRWLDMAQVSDNRRELYRYNPLARNNLSQGHGRRPTRTMTAVGLLMRMYTGWRRNNSNMVLGAEYLRANVPEIGSAREPQRDTYYWYYATQVMFHMRGDYWEAWNRRLHPLLTSSQVQTGPLAGSWDPQLPIPDRWAEHGGRLYVTTLNLLSLEVYYRHLPIYEDTAR